MDPKEAVQCYDALVRHWNGDELNRENGIEQNKRAILFTRNFVHRPSTKA